MTDTTTDPSAAVPASAQELARLLHAAGVEVCAAAGAWSPPWNDMPVAADPMAALAQDCWLAAGALAFQWLEAVRDERAAFARRMHDMTRLASQRGREAADARERAEFYEAERDRHRLGEEEYRNQLAEAEIDRDGAVSVLDRIREAHRKHPGPAEFGIVVEEILHRELGCGEEPLAGIRATAARAVAVERGRIRDAAALKAVTFWRPGNGPAHTQALEVVPLEDLLRLLEGGGPT